MLNDIELILYDLDGVLIDSREAICETFNRVLGELGIRKFPEEGIMEMIGEPLVDMFKKALPLRKHGLIPHCYNRYVEIYRDVAPVSTSVLPGVEETLSYFKKKGAKQSVATTKRSDVAGYILKHLGIVAYFDLILGVNDVKDPKPSPEIVYLTLCQLGVEKKAAVFVEDTTIGLEAGKRAGVFTVAVTTGTHPRERLADAGPDYVIDDLSEMKEIISVHDLMPGSSSPSSHL